MSHTDDNCREANSQKIEDMLKKNGSFPTDFLHQNQKGKLQTIL